MQHTYRAIGIFLLGQVAAFAQLTPTLSTVYTFNQVLIDAGKPTSITHGSRGVLYGTADNGLTSGGSIFRLTPPAPGKTQWIETVLYSFPYEIVPRGKLVLTPSGSLYGTTSVYFGTGHGCGSVFRLDPPVVAGGTWTLATLYAFQCSPDLENPQTGVIIDAAGNLYGSTYTGGPANLGGVFQLSPPTVAGGPWTESILYAFADQADGWACNGPPVFDANGNLYATTQAGGPLGQGEAFMLTPSQPGAPWNKTDIFDFNGHATGSYPLTRLLIDSTGSLYGGTLQGKSGLGGNLFQLASPAVAGQSWTETVLHSFHGPDGGPVQTLAFDTKGNLIVASGGGGNYDAVNCSEGCGVVLKANRPASPGQPWLPGWSVKMPAYPYPDGSVVFDIDVAPDGAVFGVNFLGGTYGQGTVFEIQP